MNYYQTRFSEKLKEALKAVAPIIGIVLLLSFTIAPIPPSILLLFLFGAVLLIIGMMFFTLGAELSMTPMGEKVGTKMAKTMHLGTILFLCFLSTGIKGEPYHHLAMIVFLFSPGQPLTQDTPQSAEITGAQHTLSALLKDM